MNQEERSEPGLFLLCPMVQKVTAACFPTRSPGSGPCPHPCRLRGLAGLGASQGPNVLIPFSSRMSGDWSSRPCRYTSRPLKQAKCPPLDTGQGSQFSLELGRGSQGQGSHATSGPQASTILPSPSKACPPAAPRTLEGFTTPHTHSGSSSATEGPIYPTGK